MLVQILAAIGGMQQAPAPAVPVPQEAFLARFIPRCIRDQLRDQFARLEQGSMTVSEYEARFHELSRHAAMILPTEEERVRSVARPGKKARQEDSHDRRRFRPRGSYDRSQQRFQSGQSSSPFQASLQASEGDQHRHIGFSAGPSRGRDSSQMGSSGRGSRPPALNRQSQGCYECGELDHWARECPHCRLALPTPQAVRHAPAPLARGRGQGQDRRVGHQGIRGGPRGGRLGGRADAQ
ncbi:uncharacterized protein LOC125852522, partial [Solanum stenotomum]|uniref:uncharacterized protein LOC125852522 n=1 Tax=Solanum stenotomum TaxID=172797 RepID=UPI0020D14869